METLKTKLDQFDPSLIDFDQFNPRGESEETIINDESFRGLIDSIKQYGILEPIIIKTNPTDCSRFLLVDGERRLRAAKSIKLKHVPALLIEKEIDGKILAYHVHMLRKQWGKAAETKSIKRIINEIENSTPNLNESEIKRKIKDITKTKQSRINDLYILIKYEDKFIDLVAEDKLDISYLIQGQTSFINRLTSKFPEILSEFPETRLRSIIAEKSINKLVPGTRYWMDTFRDVFNFEKEKVQIKEILLEFLEDKSVSAEATFEKFKKIRDASIALSQEKDNIPSPSGGMKRTNFKNGADPVKSTTHSITPSSLKDNNSQSTSSDKTKRSNADNSLGYSPITLTRQQQTSIKDIRPKFDKISRSFTTDEKGYIAEAIRCLEMQCFKASVLMIWATGISRVLTFISKDITEFSTKSQEMKTMNTSFYKHHCQSFQITASNIEDIRHSSKDIQLLCFLTFKNIITETQFKKLKANYDTRNDCAHPTTIDLKVNETVAIFENVLDLLINNPRLK